ncbi:MAG: ABC transporter permease subunit [Polyangiaceae bacterium]|nr:ABC transporter permease subunit [Polyangiaceae bacterium]MCL4749423.1 ABC transporter permease subunit [Myxococcales bacterium]
MSQSDRQNALFRLEMADALRSRWVVFTAAVYGAVFAAFVWLGLRESTVLGFTGLSRVVLNVANAVVIAVPLVALVASSQTIVRARTSGFFELVLAQPCRRQDWLVAVIASRVVVVLGPLAGLLLGTLVTGLVTGSDEALLPLVLRSLAVTAGLSWAFLGIGFLASSLAPTPERATVYALLAWVVGAALHDFALIGALLRFRLAPEAVFALAAANPVEAARVALLSGVDPELGVLGPVGFWLANSFGSKLTLLVGVGWPVVLGSLCLMLAARRLSRADLVA